MLKASGKSREARRHATKAIRPDSGHLTGQGTIQKSTDQIIYEASDIDVEEFINMGREMARKPYIDNSLIE